MQELKIPALRNGTVIDHLPSKVTFKVMRMLQLRDYEHTITVAINLPSIKIGKKGIIKISDRYLTKEEVNKVAILAPKATVSIIKDYNIKEKIRVKFPDIIENIVKCSNPKCITNNEDVTTHFKMVSEKPLMIRCHYCERSMSREDITLK